MPCSLLPSDSDSAANILRKWLPSVADIDVSLASRPIQDNVDRNVAVPLVDRVKHVTGVNFSMRLMGRGRR
jgi:hypothetical protein